MLDLLERISAGGFDLGPRESRRLGALVDAARRGVASTGAEMARPDGRLH